MFTELVKALALLLTLCFLHGVHIRLWRQNPTAGRITSGLLFGGIAAISIFSPVIEMQGAIFDVRSVVLSMAGLFGGSAVQAPVSGLAPLPCLPSWGWPTAMSMRAAISISSLYPCWYLGCCCMPCCWLWPSFYPADWHSR